MNKTNMTSVYFKNSLGVIRPIGSGCDFKICMSIINAFLSEHKFKSYYTQMHNCEMTIGRVTSLTTCIDVGSHTEFFYLRPAIDIMSNVGDTK